jgi:hypothetical protein
MFPMEKAKYQLAERSVTEKAKNGQMTINMDDRDRKDKINLTK